jgi:hypothetical protein
LKITGLQWRTCLGEILISVLFISTMIGWFIFWFQSDYILGKVKKDPLGPNFLAHFAMTMGHMNDFLSAFVILPISRNSYAEILFGIPFERQISTPF